MEKAEECFDRAKNKHGTPDQQREIADTQHEIAQKLDHIADKQDQIADKQHASANKLDTIGHALTADAVDLTSKVGRTSSPK